LFDNAQSKFQINLRKRNDHAQNNFLNNNYLIKVLLPGVYHFGNTRVQ
jgi:hypothetical protein